MLIHLLFILSYVYSGLFRHYNCTQLLIQSSALWPHSGILGAFKMYASNLVSLDSRSHQDTAKLVWLVPLCPHLGAGHLGHVNPSCTNSVPGHAECLSFCHPQHKHNILCIPVRFTLSLCAILVSVEDDSIVGEKCSGDSPRLAGMTSFSEVGYLLMASSQMQQPETCPCLSERSACSNLLKRQGFSNERDLLGSTIRDR